MGEPPAFRFLDRGPRRLPLPARAVQALKDHPTRLESPLLFPMIRGGGHIELAAWRGRHWAAAVRAAGLDARPPYALRHTYATFAIAAGVSLFELARFMGTSVEQIDKTYGHLLPDARERTRIALDAFVARNEKEVADAKHTL